MITLMIHGKNICSYHTPGNSMKKSSENTIWYSHVKVKYLCKQKNTFVMDYL